VLVSCIEKPQKPPEVIRPVVTIKAPGRGAFRERIFSGTANAAVETLLSFRVSGEIKELPVKKGMKVKVGALIARLDPTDYELQVKQNEAELAQAEAALEQAQAEYERTRQLYEARNASKSDLDSQQAYYKSSLAARDAAMKGLEMALQQLEYCTLRAPLAGSIASVPVEVHETVSAGQTIASMTSGDKLEMEIGIPESLIGQIRMGQQCTVHFDALPGVSHAARVSEVGIQAGDSSTYPVTLTLTKVHAGIRLGMVGEAVFRLKPASGEHAIIIPQVAVVPTTDGKHYLWIYQPDTQTVKKRMVNIGDLTSEGLQISAGLTPGEIVVVRGVHRLSEGMKVKLLDE
jgi:RND family efflux transporter MFP subunit